MIGLFTGLLTRHGRTTPRPAARRARLCLEALEKRDCPTQSLILSAIPLPGHIVELMGSMKPENLTGASITFTGAAHGTTAPDSHGFFDYLTSDAVLGTVHGVAVDGLGNSASRDADIIVANPIVSLSVTYGSQRVVTLSGQVTDLDQGSLTLSFTGKVTGSVGTRADGSFSYTAVATALGDVQATTVDLWGLASNLAAVTLTCAPPVISNFTATQVSGTSWTFSGTVSHASPAGMTVTLGGLASLTNVTVSVKSDGSFTVTVPLKPGECGIATAQTTDWWGQTSNLALANVYQGP